MTKGSKIWLWFALVLCCATTVLNGSYGRWEAVAISAVSIIGLGFLLFKEKKWGFILMCLCYALSFANGVFKGLQGEGNIIATVGMSFIGSALVPVVTYAFIHKQWKSLK